jgi:hypothetical protein
MPNYDWVSNVYDGNLMIMVQDLGSLEKEFGPEDDGDEDVEYFRRFVKLVSAS